MAKKIILDIEVNSKPVVDAKNNVDGLNNSIKNAETTTQDFGRSVKIEYDKAGKATDVLVDKELNLTKQIRAVKGQMEILTATGKGQSQEFTILQKKYNDLGDALSQNKARSQELFGTLSLLPGPVGQFAGQLQGGLDLLKTFSGIKLGDFKNQFKGVLDDVKGVIDALFGAKKATEELNNTKKETGGTTQGGTVTPAGLGGAGGAGGLGAAGVQANQALEKSYESLKTKHADVIKSLDKLEEKFNANFRITRKNEVQIQQTDKSFRNLSEAELAAVASGKSLNLVNGEIVVSTTLASRAVTFFGYALKAALIGTVIGAVIVALTEIVKLFYEFATGANAAEFAQKQFNDELERSKKYLDIDIQTVKNVHDTRIAFLKKERAEQKLVRDEELKSLKNQKILLLNAENHAANEYNKILKRKDDKAAEDLKAAGDRMLELTTENIQMNQQIRVKEQDNLLQNDTDYRNKRLKILEAQIANELDKEKTNGKLLEKYYAEQLNHRIVLEKLTGQQVINIRKDNAKKVTAALVEDNVREIQKELDKQNRILNLLEEGSKEYYDTKRTIIESEFKKEMELAKLDEKTKTQNEANAKNKKIGNTKDLNKQLEKQNEDFANRIGQITLDSIKDQQTKQVGLREEKFNQDKRALMKDINFIQSSEEEKKRLILELEDAKNKDVAKINDDARIRQMEAELSNNQMRLDVARVNTKNYFKLLGTIEDETNEINKAKLKENLDQGLITQKEYDDAMEAEARRHAKAMIDIKKQEFQSIVDTTTAMLDMTANLTNALAALSDAESTDTKKTMKEREAAFEKNKKYQKATAYISAASGIIQILTQPSTLPSPFDWIVKIGNAAALAIITAANIKKIDQTQFNGGGASGSGSSGATEIGSKPNYGDGGMIDGPRHAEGGVAINAEGGEAVMTRGAVTMFKPLLSIMNQMGGGTSFTKGASGQASYDNPKDSNLITEQQIIKTYVVEQDLTSVQHRNARLKDLSTL